jgi:hypothetical protein
MRTLLKALFSPPIATFLPRVFTSLQLMPAKKAFFAGLTAFE